MKRIIALILVLLFAFAGCSTVQEKENTTADAETTTLPLSDEKDSQSFFQGAWISYIELKKLGRSEEEYEKYIDGLFQNLKEVGTTDVFVHVRAFSDALYDSEIFPYAAYMGEGEKTDVLALSLSMAEKYGMSIHPWINPYRAFSSSDADKSGESKIKGWVQENSPNVICVDGKYYLNPASDEVRNLIIDGVREILTKYPTVKGIHIDDYFYPENIGDADSEDYNAYLMSGGKLSLESWRRENVSSLISSVYSTVKSFSEDKIFSISPCGSVEKNVNTLYADVELWASQKGFCDMLIPQVYFGFENASQPFCSTVDEWARLTAGSDVRLVIGLALYKCGQEDVYAGKGSKEWTEHSDIISRQVRYVREKNLDGYSLYSASFVNFSESFLSKELDMLKSVI